MSEMSERSLSGDELYNVMFHLSTRDVVHCMQVCQHWKTVLSEKRFWKEYVRGRFDLRVNPKSKEHSHPLYRWADPREQGRLEFKIDFAGGGDTYVMRPFPIEWNCGVVVPFGFDPMLLDTKHFSGLCRSLEILSYMKEGIETLGLRSGAECGVQRTYSLSVVLMRWDGDKLPSDVELAKDVFPFHPVILRDVHERLAYSETQGTLDEIFEWSDFSEKIYFHLGADDDHDYSKGDKCLNSFFGRKWHREEDKTYDYDKELAFFTWLQDIMVPSTYFVIGAELINPAVVFFLTNLAPSWVGGILTGDFYE